MKYFIASVLAGLFGILVAFAVTHLASTGGRLAYHQLFDGLGHISYQAAVGTALTSDVGASLTSDVRLTFVGDVMLDRGVKQSVLRNGGDYSWLFAKLGNWPGDAVLFGNLEGPLSDQGSDRQNLYSFRISPEALPALQQIGFQVLSVANNHIGDWGREAFSDTIARLASASILAAGGGRNKAEAAAPKVLTVKGARLGFLAFSDVGPPELAATDNQAGIILATDPDLPQIIRRAADQVDTLIVSFHWGEEYQTQASARQQNLAHLAVDNGAKLVIGQHPHVVEGLERYHDGLIAYSLGNFIFDQPFSAATMSGGVLTVTLKDKQITNADLAQVNLDQDFRPSL